MKKKKKKQKAGVKKMIWAWRMVRLPGFWSSVRSLQEQPCLPSWNAAGVTRYRGSLNVPGDETEAAAGPTGSPKQEEISS